MKIIRAGQDEAAARLPKGAKIDAEPRQVAPQQIDMLITRGWEHALMLSGLPPRSQGCRRFSPPTYGRDLWLLPSATSPAARPGSWCAIRATAAASASPPSPAATAPRPTSRHWRTAWPSSSEPGRATMDSSRSQVRLGRPHQASPSLQSCLWEQLRLGNGAPGWSSHLEYLKAQVEGGCL